MTKLEDEETRQLGWVEKTQFYLLFTFVGALLSVPLLIFVNLVRWPIKENPDLTLVLHLLGAIFGLIFLAGIVPLIASTAVAINAFIRFCDRSN